MLGGRGDSQAQINENGKISVEKSRCIYPKLECLLVSLVQVIHVPPVSSPSLPSLLLLVASQGQLA